MSEFDDSARTGRRGGLGRDGLRGGTPSTPEPSGTERLGGVEESIENLYDALRFLGSDSTEFRRRFDRILVEFEAVRRRYRFSCQQLADAERQNEKLVHALQEAKQQIELLKEEVDKLCAPPNSYGILKRSNKDGTAEIIADGRPMRVNIHPKVDPNQFEEGQLVLLNEAFNIIDAGGFTSRGEIVSVVEPLGDGRVIVLGHTDNERVVTLASPLRREPIKTGDHLLIDPRTQYAFERMPKSGVEEVMLEEIPDVTYAMIGGLADQIQTLRDSIELPYLHPEVFVEHKLAPPKGILLYGPPGCGKTLIAKAVANSLAHSIEKRTGRKTSAYFLNVKGPELLNKYVGETEHKIREVFYKAREKASEDVPVVIFFDEMDSLFRMRGSGISSDMEATVVAQFLSEIDGVESLKNVIVIGASNRQDLIDPAVLRPGRLDLKVKVNRPNAEAAHDIFGKYLVADLPFHRSAEREFGSDPQKIAEGLIRRTIETMYATNDENKFLEVTYAKGEREIFYFKDFASGAMIQNIVDRAKTRAVKRFIDSRERGIQAADLLAAVREEFKENEDLPNTTNPDDWARISGRKGERIVNVRTLITGINRNEGRSVEDIRSGQYL